MTLYLTANALKSGQVHLTDPVTISANAWRMGGSKMFIKQNSSVPLGQLIDGVVIASGNDAAVAIAEFLGGSEQNFVNSMNQTAKKLNLTNTNFVDSNGLPAENHYSCARDLANLARVWILDLPDYYPWFKQKWITFNRIKQPNRNRLLWRDPSVDGMKTGHTDNAGYCLIASALRNNMRLVAVIMGAPSDGTRFDYAERLLDYGYRYFESHKLYTEGKALTRQRVWFGKEKMLSLGLRRDLYATTQMGHYKNLTANLSVNKDLKAPINKGDTLGTVNVFAGGKLISSEPLIALNDVPKAGLFGSFFDHIAWFFHRFL
jgi:D-alanyl-D-alanine carboxypeptidase (penicillin-binding protein 5/6)